MQKPYQSDLQQHSSKSEQRQREVDGPRYKNSGKRYKNSGKRYKNSGKTAAAVKTMCGILGIFDVAPGTTQSTLRAKLIECARRMRHRGPDWSGYQLISQGKDKQELGAGQHASSESLQRLCIAEHGVRGAAKHAIAHERLAIIDPESGAQPLFAAECKQAGIEEGSIIVAANGEIYNYKVSDSA